MAVATDSPTTVSVTVGGQDMTFETGKLAKQADGAVVVRSGETMVLATAQGRMEAARGRRLLPAHSGRRGADVRRREDPGRLLQA